MGGGGFIGGDNVCDTANAGAGIGDVCAMFPDCCDIVTGGESVWLAVGVAIVPVGIESGGVGS